MDWNALGPDGLPDERRGRARPVRPGLRALRHAEPPAGGGRAWPPPRPGLSDPVSYGAPRPNVPLRPPLRRGHPGPSAQPGMDRPAGLLHGRPTPARSSAPSRPRPRWWSTATPRASSTPPRSGLLAGNPTILYAGTLDTDPPLRRRTLGGAGRPGGHRHQPQAGLSSGTPSTRTPATPRRPPRARTPPTRADAPLNLFPEGPGRRPDHRGASAGSPRSPPRPTGPRSPTCPRTGPPPPSTATPRRPGWTTPSPRQLGPVVAGGPATIPTTVGLARPVVQPQTGDPDRSITEGHPHLRRPAPGRRPPRPRVPHAARAGDHLPVPDLHHPPHHHRPGWHVADPAVAGDLAQLGRLRRGGDPRRDRRRDRSPCPRTCCGRPGPSSAVDRLSLVMTRLRSSGTPPRSRHRDLARTAPSGCPTAADLLDDRVGPHLPAHPRRRDRPAGGRDPGPTAPASWPTRSAGCPVTSGPGPSPPWTAIPTTLWEPGFGATHQAGDWLQYRLPQADHLRPPGPADRGRRPALGPDRADRLGRRPDGHGRPCRPLADSPVPGSVVDVPVSFPPLTGQSIRITVDGVRIENTPNYYSQDADRHAHRHRRGGDPRAAGRARCRPTSPPSCRSDLLTRGRQPRCGCRSPVRPRTALDRQPLTVSLCGPDAGGAGPRPRRPHPAVDPGPDHRASTSTSWPSTRLRAAAPCRWPPPPPWPPRRCRPSPAVHVDSQTADLHPPLGAGGPCRCRPGPDRPRPRTEHQRRMEGLGRRRRLPRAARSDRRFRQRLAPRPRRRSGRPSTTAPLSVVLRGNPRSGWTWP